MNFFINNILNNFKYLLLPLFAISHCVKAMEQEPQKFFLTDISIEILTHIALMIPIVAENQGEALYAIEAFSLTFQDCNSILKDKIFIQSFIKKFIKKFKTQKLMLPHKYKQEAQKQFHEKITTIIQYAFVYCNDLLKINGGITSLPCGAPLTTSILKYAFETLKQMRKNNPSPWKNSSEIKKLFNQLADQKIIEIEIDGYPQATEAYDVAIKLLYLSKNCKTHTMEPYVLANKSVFSKLNQQAYNHFFPDGETPSASYSEMKKRFKTI